jgi:DNA repair protein RecN (Recombination protein N)
MLVELLVENFAVADRVRLGLHAGLNVLTGETGSGKSIIVDSLGLLFGGRASAESVRSGAERARITGIFELPRDKALLALLEAAGVEAEDGEVLVEREILANGKSRAFVGSKPVAASFLRELAPFFGDIHGQHDQQRLFGAKEQMAMLDEFAQTDTAPIAKIWRELRRQEAELAELDRQEQEMLQKQDLWRFQKDEIESAGLKPNEDRDLEQELRVLANVVRLKEQASVAFAALSESEGSAAEMLGSALKQLGELRRIDENLDDIFTTLRGAETAMSEAARDLGRYLDRLEADPGRLSFVEGRLADIDKLRRKYGHSVTDILEHYNRVCADLEVVENASVNRGQLREQIDALRQSYTSAAAALTAQRRKAAARLEKRVEGELKDLSMERSRFVVALTTGDWSENGADTLQFLISTNLGEEAKPLERVASGGELSRLALALKVALIGQTPQAGMRTLVFDEVDAGIGGNAAEQVGRKLKALSKGNQLLCVTHLAQIAAFGDSHFAVEKREAQGRTHSVVEELDPTGRVKEIARMIGGQRLGEEALRYATQLIQLGSAG